VGVSAFADLAELTALRVWDGVLGRVPGGERMTMAVVELDQSSVVPEHSHEHEQIGVCEAGSLTYRVGDEARELGRGDTWWTRGGISHEVRTGPSGAAVVETWAPRRDDWAALDRIKWRPPRWPR
jgi:quercetin dioxygenase-like cupin family protein